VSAFFTLARHPIHEVICFRTIREQAFHAGPKLWIADTRVVQKARTLRRQHR